MCAEHTPRLRGLRPLPSWAYGPAAAMSFLQALDQAAGAAVCNWLNTGGNAVLGTFVVRGLLTPGAQVPSAAAGLGLLALNAGCSFNPSGQIDQGPSWKGCSEVSAGGELGFYVMSASGVQRWFTINLRQIHSVKVAYHPTNSPSQPRYLVDLTPNNGSRESVWGPTLNSGDYYDIRVLRGTCINYHDSTGPASLPPVTYTDQSTNCTYNTEFLAWHQDAQNTIRPVVKISQGPSSRASGGVIGGCNFDPVIYVPGGGGGGGGPVIPWLPGPDNDNGDPWWVDAIQGAIGGVVSELIEQMLKQFFEVKLPATTYRLVSACETDAGGESVSQSVETTIPELPIQEGIAARLDALVPIAQGLKDFKQPVCEPFVPATSGTSISVQFRSTVPSPNGDNPLRKAFRYRDQTNKDIAEHRDHWIGFTWESGPWMVISEGLPWGKPRVWAKSAEEGKRVLGHAAAIAGVNLADPAHRWVIREVHNPRYGEVLPMKVHRDKHGHWWVATRNGPSGFPFVA